MYKQEALIVSALLLSVLVTSRAAPLVKNTDVHDTGAQVNEHEQELEKLVNAENSKVRNPEFHESRSVSFKNVNGHINQIQEDERTVVDGDTGDLVSDLKQQIAINNEASGHPYTEVDTEVAIPSLGVHQSLSQSNDEEDEQPQLPYSEITESDMEDMAYSPDISEAVDFTPKAVAEYLWETQEFREFKTALQDLVNSRLMTDKEAWQYYQRVIDEYERIVADNEQLEQVLPDLYRPLFSSLEPTSNQIPDNKRASADSLYDRLIGPSYETDSNMYPDVRMPYMYDAEAMPSGNDDGAKALVREWLVNAFQTGDEQAVRVLQNLNQYLDDQSEYGQSEDDQLREVLADLLVETLVNERENNVEADQEQEQASEQSESESESEPENETEAENTEMEAVAAEPENNFENNETEAAEEDQNVDSNTEESSDDNNTENESELETKTEEKTNKAEEESS